MSEIELKEKIARAICASLDDGDQSCWQAYSGEVDAALTAIEEAGYVLTRKQHAEGVTHPCEPYKGPIPYAVHSHRVQMPEYRYQALDNRSYATLADSATTFDLEAQFDRDIDAGLK